MSDLFSKPVVHNLEKKKQIVLDYLKANEYATKKQLCTALGWEFNKNKDRQIRDIVSVISKEYPIISTSDTNKGFRLAKELSDLEEVQHSWKWIDSMIEELEKRKLPLIKFHEEYAYIALKEDGASMALVNLFQKTYAALDKLKRFRNQSSTIESSNAILKKVKEIQNGGKA